MHKIRLLKSVTLVELVVVTIIIGVVASVSVPNFIKAIERARDREAVDGLLLIQTGERIYSSRYGFVFPNSGIETNIAVINTNLKIELPPETSWDFWVQRVGGDYIAYARRTAGLYAGRRWQIRPSWLRPRCTTGPCP